MSIEGGRLFAIPYHHARGTPEAAGTKNTLIMDWLTKHPFWFNAPLPFDELYLLTAQQLTSGQHVIYEVWDGGTIVGLLCLSRVMVGVDGLLHFTLWGSNFFAARRLIWNFIGTMFEQFNLQRISVEIPDTDRKFLRTVRRYFGFLYEGELDSTVGALASSVMKKGVTGIGAPSTEADCRTWLARMGSRREKGHWTGKQYSDVYLLRLLRSEFDERSRLDMGQATLEDGDSSCRLEPNPPNILSSLHPT